MEHIKLNLNNTVAIVIGIEKYVFGTTLNGPAHDAIDLARWLCNTGVQRENIYLYLSSDIVTIDETLIREFPKIKEATRRIYDDLNIEIRLSEPKDLIFFWSGHGSLSNTDKFHLHYSDNSEEIKENLFFNSLVKFLSHSFSDYSNDIVYKNQLFIIDACRSYTNWGTNPQEVTFATTRHRGNGIRRAIIYSANPGEFSINLDAQKTGVFYNEFKPILESSVRPSNTELDLNLGEVRTQLDARFQDLQKNNSVVKHTPAIEFIDFRFGTDDQGEKSPLIEAISARELFEIFQPNRISDPTCIYHNPKHIPSIDAEIFYPPTLSNETIDKSNSLRNGAGAQTSREIFEEWLAKDSINTLVGWSGSGKTTLLQKWSNDLYQELKGGGQHIPLFIDLGELKDEPHPDDYFLNCALHWKYQIDTSSLMQEAQYKLVWLLDSWEELNENLQKRWVDVINNLPGTKVITCRRSYYNKSIPGDVYYLNELDSGSQREFITMLVNYLKSKPIYKDRFSQADSVYVDQLWRDVQNEPYLKRIARIPFILRLIVHNHPPDDNPLPKNRNELYQEIYEGFFNRQRFDPDYGELIQNESSKGLFDNIKQFLEDVVFNTRLESGISKDLLYRTHKTQCNLPEPEKTLGLLDRVELLFKRESVWKYEFRHSAFLEWFLANALERKKGLYLVLQEHWLNPKYEEVLSFMWTIASSEDRNAASGFLLEEGCRDFEIGSQTINRSGLRACLRFWQRSGLDMDPEIINKLKPIITTTENKMNAVANYTHTPLEILKMLADSDIPDKVLISVASNRNVSLALQRKLCEHKNPEVRVALADNWATDQKLLATLSKDNDYRVREATALNRNTPSDSLAQLIKDPSQYVLRMVARNRRTPPNALTELASKTKNREVLRGIAGNPNTPSEILLKLCEHSDNTIKLKLAKNPNSNSIILKALSFEREPSIRRAIASNRNTPKPTLFVLSRDQDDGVMKALRNNPHTPPDIKQELFKELSPIKNITKIPTPRSTSTIPNLPCLETIE